MMAGLLPSCPQLTALQFRDFTASDAGLGALQAATGLQDLVLRCTGAFLPGSVLQKLTRLTHLYLKDLQTQDDAGQHTLQHISCLINLRGLTVQTEGLSPVLPDAGSGLIGLTQLCLEGGTLNPAVLMGCTQLRRLVLWVHVVEQPSQQGSAAAAGRMLLSCLGRMPHLQHLLLQPKTLEWPADASAYTALTASSELKELRLGASQDGSEPPKGVWCAMLHEGARWPALQEVQSVLWDNTGQLPASALTTAELSRLVSCCPGLQACELRVQHDMQPLSGLQGLTRLYLYEPTEATFRSLTALTRLEELHAQGCPFPMCPSLLVGLTALRSLTSLDSDEQEDVEDWVDEDGNNPFYVQLHKADADDSEPVWLQLQRHCAGYPSCHPYLLEGLVQTVAEQQRAAAQEQQVQQRLRQQLEQQVEGQQLGQLSAAQAEAAELRGRVAALEGQLAKVLQALQQQQQQDGRNDC